MADNADTEASNVSVAGSIDAQTAERQKAGELFALSQQQFPQISGDETQDGLLELLIPLRERVGQWRTSRHKMTEPPGGFIMGQLVDKDGRKISDLTYKMIRDKLEQIEGKLYDSFNLRGRSLEVAIKEFKKEEKPPTAFGLKRED